MPTYSSLLPILQQFWKKLKPERLLSTTKNLKLIAGSLAVALPISSILRRPLRIIMLELGYQRDDNHGYAGVMGGNPKKP